MGNMWLSLGRMHPEILLCALAQSYSVLTFHKCQMGSYNTSFHQMELEYFPTH